MNLASSSPPEDAAEPSPPSLTHGQLFLRFLRFGFMAWGGPVAQIAMLRRELVDEERWISSARFNRLLAVMQALPGPEAHEMCVHLGIRAKGRVGGLLAGLGFMLPGFALMMGLSWLYFAMDITGSWLGAAFLGVQAAVVALIVRAVHRIGEHILVDRWLWAIAVGCAAAAFAGVSFWITLPGAGLVYALRSGGRRGLAILAAVLAAGVGLVLAFATETPAPISAALTGEAGHAPLVALFLSGLKGGLLTFGGAYTAIPFLRSDAVGRGWMSDGQFLDGLALSGVLPAPLIIFSTFVGYVAGGPLGALVMTAGIFLPAFSFSLILYDRLEAIMEFEPLHRALEGLAAGVVGLIAATAVQLAVSAAQRTPAIVDSAIIFAMSTTLLYVWKNRLNVVAIILAAGVAGCFMFSNLLEA